MDTQQQTPSSKYERGFSPALRDAYDLFADLCILTRVQGVPSSSLGNLFAAIGGGERDQDGEKVRLLKGLNGLGRTFGLELVESLVGGFEGCLKAVSSGQRFQRSR